VQEKRSVVFGFQAKKQGPVSVGTANRHRLGFAWSPNAKPELFLALRFVEYGPHPEP
jgi:hypothetical protein